MVSLRDTCKVSGNGGMLLIWSAWVSHQTRSTPDVLLDISRRLQLKRPLQFVLSICKIVLLRKDTGQQAMSSGMGGIERLGGAELADRLRLILQVVPGCA